MVKLYNSENPVQTSQIIAALEAEGIPVVKKDVGSSGYMTITSGMSLMGSDLYVDEQAAEQAKEIVAGIVGEVSSDEEEDENKILRRQGLIKRLVASVLLLLMLAGIIVSRMS
ncbi:MAG: DUF2007 domain-containing protein [Lachnospiraceae bacterium]|nr:DUF2007 domain-containing protein [Lachnospiraceae bacterium]